MFALGFDEQPTSRITQPCLTWPRRWGERTKQDFLRKRRQIAEGEDRSSIVRPDFELLLGVAFLSPWMPVEIFGSPASSYLQVIPVDQKVTKS